MDSANPKNEKEIEFPNECYSNETNKLLGILSPSRVQRIIFGEYGEEVLKQFREAEKNRLRR